MRAPPKASASLKRTERQWLNKLVTVYVRSLDNKKLGPYRGTVKGVSTNEVSATDEAAREFHATGLLVEIPELGRNTTYGEWPVYLADAVLAD